MMEEKGEEVQKAGVEEIAKEHMFDKVVTPSDVGKLNRLVIPKQHAEKYFPLDPNSNDKGLLLNFEDVRGEKSWRFRYSYWNSSQSYVMTKGWSRFVKEKKLDAGDIVSFQRGAPETSRDRLFIDWRRRPQQYPTSMGFNFNFPPNANAFYNFPQPRDLCNFDYTYHHLYGYGNTINSMGRCYMGQNPVMVGEPVPNLVYDSVPVVIRRTQPAVVTGKRLRLFGVNMECESSTEDESASFGSLTRGEMGYSPCSSLRLHSGEESSEMQIDDRNLKKGKSSSLSFNLDQ